MSIKKPRSEEKTKNRIILLVSDFQPIIHLNLFQHIKKDVGMSE